MRRYGKQQTVFAAHSAVRHVFVVVSGALKISEYGEKGAAHISCASAVPALARTLSQLVASGHLVCRMNVFWLPK